MPAQDRTFHDDDDWTQFDAWLDQIKADAASSGELWEVYIIEHPHEDTGEDCTCVQYMQDNRAYWSNQIDGE